MRANFRKAPKTTESSLADRILIAGVGNVLHQDDGFGIEVVRQLQRLDSLPESVKVMETGIGGISLVQELYDPYDALLLVDAVSRDGEAGQIYFLKADVSDISELPTDEKRDFLADMHYATPSRALMLAKALNVLPTHVYILGCQPSQLDDFQIGLSDPIREAIPQAVERIEKWVRQFLQEAEALDRGHE